MPVDREIKARAYDREAGVYRCEGKDCGCVVSIKERPVEGSRPAQIDHKRACWTQSADEVKDRPPLTAADGWLICVDCHKAKSAREARERARTDGAAKIHAAHLAALAAKLEGDVETVAKPKRTWPTQKLKSRGFPKKEDRQLFSKGYHHGR